MSFEVKVADNRVTIYNNGLLHLTFKKEGLVGIQSYIDGDKNMYTIEYYFEKDVVISTEYNTIEKWIEILKQLNDKIVFT